MTALHHGVEHGSCVGLLLEEEALVDAQDHEGRTPSGTPSPTATANPPKPFLTRAPTPTSRTTPYIFTPPLPLPNVIIHFLCSDLMCVWYLFGKKGESPMDVASEELRKVIESALNMRSAEARREKKQQLQTAIKKFNRNPEKGIEYLVAHGLNDGTPEDIARFLRNTSGLNKTAAGDYLSDLPELSRLTLRCFLDQLTFAGTSLFCPPCSPPPPSSRG